MREASMGSQGDLISRLKSMREGQACEDGSKTTSTQLVYSLLEKLTTGHGLDRMRLLSGYPTVCKSEPRFTNFTSEFQGTLDYIWFSPNTLAILAISAVDDAKSLREECALPSSTRPSDHISLVCTLLFSTPGETGEIAVNAQGQAQSSKRFIDLFK